MSIILNSTTTWTDKDLTSEVQILSYTAVRDSLVWIQVVAGTYGADMLDGGGAILTYTLYRDAKNDQRLYQATLDTTGFANPYIVLFTFDQPFFVKSGDTLLIMLQSSNGSDTQVDGEVYLIDHHARDYSNDDLPKVDAYTVGGATPLSAAGIADAVCDELLSGHITAGTLGKILQFINDVLEGDTEIDTTTTPWQLVVKTKGTSTELIRKDLKDINNANLTAISTIIGKRVEP